MRWRKKFLRSWTLPKHWTLKKKVSFVAHANNTIFERCEFAILHNGRILYFAARPFGARKKFRMRAYAQAKKIADAAERKFLRLVARNYSISLHGGEKQWTSRQ